MPNDRSTTNLTGVVDRNVRVLLDAKREDDRTRSRQQQWADKIGDFAGSLPFVYLHLAVFGGWLLINAEIIPVVKPWDPYPFVMLAMFASVEAIFLSTFVLINQNRQARISEQRADLDLQISLLAEHELTRLIHLVDAIREKVGAPLDEPEHVDEIKKDIPPEKVIERIRKAEQRFQKDGRV